MIQDATKPQVLMGIAWASTTGTIFWYATNAYRSIVDRHPDERAGGQHEAVVAIVFAAAALEAFINEAGHIAAMPLPFGHPPHPPAVNTLAQVLEQAEESRLPTQTKFVLAKWILSGQPYPQDRAPYQDFKTLLDLRNALVHVKNLEMTEFEVVGGVSRPVRYNYERLMAKLPQNILSTGAAVTWIERLLTLAVARWACNVAIAMVTSILPIVPPGDFADRIAGLGYAFQLP